MKIDFIKIFAVVITFIAGTGAVLLLSVLLRNQPQLEISDEIIGDSQSVLNVCQLLDLPNEYDGKLISFETTAHISNQKIVLLPKDCTSNNYFSLSLSPEMKLANFKGENNNLNTLLKRNEEIDLRITGVAKTGYAGGYSTPIFSYSITPVEIQLISSIRRFEARFGH